MIIAGLHPNATPVHTALSKRYLFSSSSFSNTDIAKLDNVLSSFTGVKKAFAVDSGRSALFIVLCALSLPKGSYIGISAYTCIVVRNAIIAAGHRPYYIDIDDSLGLDPESLPREGTVQAIITQHTFGVVHHQYKKIIDWARKRHIPILEDSAHLCKNEPSLADIRIHSFGPEKPISAIRGGAIMVFNDTYLKPIEAIIKKIPHQPKRVTKRLARTQLLFNALRKYFPHSLTKTLFLVAKKTQLTMPILEGEELSGNKPDWQPTRIGEMNASIALQELVHLTKRNAHRQNIFHVYQSVLPNHCFVQKSHVTDFPLEVPINVNQLPKAVLQTLANKGIFLSPSWLYTPIVPAASHKALFDYEVSSLQTCKQAQKIIPEIITLPTHQLISPKDAKTIATLLRPYV